MLRIVIVLACLAALGLAAGIAVAGPGVRHGFWDYGFGLTLIRNLALPVMIAAGAALVALLLSLWKARGYAAFSFIALLAAAGAALVPLQMKARADAHPFIHDITTDFENPPEIIKAADAERKNPAAYAGAEQAAREDEGVTVADAQANAYPDIAPLFAPTSIDETVEAVRDVLADMKMEVIAEGPVSDSSGDGWRVEAVATSTWFGFKDDFVVRVSPGEAGGSRVDVRSKSRVGLSDLGANADRIRAFMKKLDAVV